MRSEEIKTEWVHTMLVMINSYYVNQQQQWLEALQLLELMHVTSGRQTDKKSKYPALGKGSMSPMTLVTAAIRHCTNPDGLRKMSSDIVQSQQEHCQRMSAEPCSPCPYAKVTGYRFYKCIMMHTYLHLSFDMHQKKRKRSD